MKKIILATLLLGLLFYYPVWRSTEDERAGVRVRAPVICYVSGQQYFLITKHQ